MQRQPAGDAAIEAFLTRKWSRELDYRLIKEVWTFRRPSRNSERLRQRLSVV
jgi:nuclear transport factor 2 (NTF2) superfamily protein